MSKKTTKYLGMALIIGFIVVSLGAFIMAASSSKYFNSKYNPNVLQSLNGYMLACAGVIFLFSFLGIASLYCESKILLIIFEMIWFALFILTFIVSILALLSGSVKDFGNFKCVRDKSANLTTKLDDYLSKIDQEFCSDNCICHIMNKTMFSNVPTNYWRTDNISGAINFDNCRVGVKNSVYTSANIVPSDLSKIANDTYDSELFFKTWKWVEETYECTGFCDSMYTNKYNQTVKYYKYLFSDLNRGTPRNSKACFYVILEETIKYFSSNGLYILLASFYMLIIFIICCTWFYAEDSIEFYNDNQRTIMINPRK